MKFNNRRIFEQTGRVLSAIANPGSRIAFCLIIAVVVFLFAGFFRFSMVIASYKNTIDSKANGIVVLTGGRARIEAGLQLLKQKRGERLLISGVHKSTSTMALASRYKIDKQMLSCCIDIDRIAKDTVENGLETAKWIDSNHFKSVLVVTSDYHMPRSLLELARAMPNVSLIPHVASVYQDTRNAHLGSSERLRVTVREYFKTIVASLNLNGSVSAN